MNSFERVVAAISHKEPDQVPLVLLPTLHGARECRVSIREYFSDPLQVVRGQEIIREKYGLDDYSSFYYASLETEAFGGETIFTDDGPPVTGNPIIKNSGDIDHLRLPEVSASPPLKKCLDTTNKLAELSRGETPVIGVVISPFSLPAMQMGLGPYLQLLYQDEERFEGLMEINTAFTEEWAKCQIEAGANALVYFDPVSSPTIIPPDLYRATGHRIASSLIPRINAPVVTAFASGRCFSIIEDVIATRSAGIIVSEDEDLGTIRSICRDRIAVFGNMNGIAMRHWSVGETEEKVLKILQDAGKGGGFVLSEQHGEIPLQVPEEVLFAIRDAVRTHGSYT
ncbi:MAG: uroporphyrinogen decarboxylase family protein [Methanospirillum sp.]|nr:uroporphyrinogen decarboxylase family protein [Methanospirillum sp.]